jgi:hypothetical protein
MCGKTNPFRINALFIRLNLFINVVMLMVLYIKDYKIKKQHSDKGASNE